MHMAVRLVHYDVDVVGESDGSNLNQVVKIALVVRSFHEHFIVDEPRAHELLICVSVSSKMLEITSRYRLTILDQFPRLVATNDLLPESYKKLMLKYGEFNWRKKHKLYFKKNIGYILQNI
jgi:hypothetical protein